MSFFLRPYCLLSLFAIIFVIYVSIDLASVVAVAITVVITILIAVFIENNHKYIEKNENTITTQLKPIIDAEISKYLAAIRESEKRIALSKVSKLDFFRVALKDEGEKLNHALLYFGGCVVCLLVLIALSPYAPLGDFFKVNPSLPTMFFYLLAEFIIFFLIVLTLENFGTLWKINKVVRGYIQKNEDLSTLVMKHFGRERQCS